MRFLTRKGKLARCARRN